MSKKLTDFPIVLVKNLPYEISSEELYELFGTFGNILEVRKGSKPETKGTAFIVYQNLQAAKLSIEKLNGYNFNNRYLVCLLYIVDRSKLDRDLIESELELNNLK